MPKKIIIGIDIGGSSTKIVGFDCSGKEKQLIEPIFVKAEDPLTSIYGAFGKFTSTNQLSISDISKIMVTGVGSTYISEPLYNIPSERISEFKSLGLGGLYLSGLPKTLVISMGTGTALVYAEKGKKPLHLGGTGVGGGTLIGLSKQLLGMDTVDHISDLAKNGNLRKVDLKVGDMTGKESLTDDKYSGTMTASNFGNISDLADKSDMALAIINMVFETIAMVSIFAARSYNIKDMVLTGNLTSVSQAPEFFKNINEMFDVNFIMPTYAQFATAIGAALAGIK